MMDYKKIFRSREMRQKILEAMAWIPDKPMLKLQYHIKTGRKLNLKNPQRYTEKLQWYKLYYRDHLMIQCVDKYDVREYVRSRGLERILNECYGIYDRVEDIDFGTLPDQFVLKDTLGSGGNSVIICRDKSSFDIAAAKKHMKNWIDTKLVKSGGREWPYYSGKKHRILIEEYLEADSDEMGQIDYKFFCFNGIFEYLYVIAGRKLCKGAQLGIFLRSYEKTDCRRVDELPLTYEVSKPDGYEEMIWISEVLSKDFPQVRIDLFSTSGKIRFGEITFFDGSGYMKFDPDVFDFTLGKAFVLPKKRENL